MQAVNELLQRKSSSLFHHSTRGTSLVTALTSSRTKYPNFVISLINNTLLQRHTDPTLQQQLPIFSFFFRPASESEISKILMNCPKKQSDSLIWFLPGFWNNVLLSLILFSTRADSGSHFVSRDPLDPSFRWFHPHDPWPMTQSQTMAWLDHDYSNESWWFHGCCLLFSAMISNLEFFIWLFSEYLFNSI